MTKRPACIVFDWNGTLLADTRVVFACTNHVLKTVLDHQEISFTHYRNSYDMPISKIYVRAGVDEKLFMARRKELGTAFHDTYMAKSGATRLRRGARALLNKLRQHHVVSVVLSNHITGEIRRHTKRLEIDGHFHDVLANASREEQAQNRPKADRLHAFMEAHKLTPSQMVIVGDSAEEPEIAHQLGMTGIAITDGHVSTARLRAAKPHHLVNTLHEVGVIAERMGMFA